MRGWVAAGLTTAVALPLLGFPTPQEPAQESRTGWIRRLYATNRCSFGDGVRAVAGLQAGAPVGDSFEVLRKRLVDANVLPESWGDGEKTDLTHGRLAYLLCGALDIKGGVSLSVFGRTERYALRELIFNGIVERGVPMQIVSGRELIDIIRRAEIYRKEGSLDSIRK